MRLKKISTSALCYLVLVAFFSVICMEVSYAKFHSHKTEVSPISSINIVDLNVIEEEESDVTELFDAFYFTHIFSFFNYIPVFILLALFSGFFVFSHYLLFFKTPIFLRYRVLRL